MSTVKHWILKVRVNMAILRKLDKVGWLVANIDRKHNILC